MKVNGLPLPAALEQIVRDAQGRWSAWEARQQTDSYGNYFAGYYPEIYNLVTMAEVTAALPDRCPAASEELFELFAGEPGVIPNNTDFSQIVAFAQLESGETFCLDYRENECDPEVILYEGAHWRRVAPSFGAFMERLQPSEGRPARESGAETESSPPERVNGLALPAALVQIMRKARREWTQWMMKEPDWRKRVNAYGDEYDCGDFEIYDYDRMVEETNELPDRFEPWSEEEYKEEAAQHPDVIPYIEDYSWVVVFGQVGSGEPHCLDYRENLQQPSVFYLPAYGVYYRRVAPSFDGFLELVVPHDDEEYDRRMAEEDAYYEAANRGLREIEAMEAREALTPVELKAIAYHEAGQAVAAVVLGLALQRTSILHPVNGEGRTTLDTPDSASLNLQESRDRSEREMVFGFAGRPARRLVDPNTDMSAPVTAEEWLLHGMPDGSLLADWPGLSLGEGYAHYVAPRVIGEPDPEANEAEVAEYRAAAVACLREARSRAGTLVQEHHAAIAAVAAELLRSLELDGEQVRAIVGKSPGSENSSAG